MGPGDPDVLDGEICLDMGILRVVIDSSASFHSVWLVEKMPLPSELEF